MLCFLLSTFYFLLSTFFFLLFSFYFFLVAKITIENVAEVATQIYIKMIHSDMLSKKFNKKLIYRTYFLLIEYQYIMYLINFTVYCLVSGVKQFIFKKIDLLD